MNALCSESGRSLWDSDAVDIVIASLHHELSPYLRTLTTNSPHVFHCMTDNEWSSGIGELTNHNPALRTSSTSEFVTVSTTTFLAQRERSDHEQ